MFPNITYCLTWAVGALFVFAGGSSEAIVSIPRSEKYLCSELEKETFQVRSAVSLREKAHLRDPGKQPARAQIALSKGLEGTQLPVIKGRTLRRDSLLRDIDLLEQGLTSMHPGLYRYQTPEAIEWYFDQLRLRLTDPMPETEFMRVLAQTVARIRCGHTYLNPWNLNPDVRERLFGGARYLPLGFRILDGRFIATVNVSEAPIERGADLVSINGIPAATIYDSLRTIARSDGNNFAPYSHYLSLDDFEESEWEAFDLYFPLFFPLTSDSFRIEYSNFGDNRLQTVRVKALTKAERTERVKERYGSSFLDNDRWTLEILENELAVMKLGTFAIWNWEGFDAEKWFQDAFARLDSAGVKRLVVDIRGNGGGLDAPKNELISYLVRDTMRCAEAGKVLIRTTRIEPELVPYIYTWVKPIIEGLPSEMYEPYKDGWYLYKEPSECEDIAPKANRFTGKTYLFGDASNVSATFDLLQKTRQNGFATFIGETSGGNQQGINGGAYAFFYLPYSKLEVDIPLKFFAPPGSPPDAGVEPEVRLEITRKDVAAGRDVYLEYVKMLDGGR